MEDITYNIPSYHYSKNRFNIIYLKKQYMSDRYNWNLQESSEIHIISKALMYNKLYF